MVAQSHQSIITMEPSIPKILKVVEWFSLGIPLLRMLFPILYKPLGYDSNFGDYLVFTVLVILAVLSLRFPIDRPLWQRRAYIWFEIVCLLFTRLFSGWGLDLLLWLVLGKGCFLMSRKEAILTAIASGIIWQGALAYHVTNQLLHPKELQDWYESLSTVPISLQVFDVILNNISIFVAANLLIILMCLSILSERQSRHRASVLAQEVETLAADLERTRIARDIHDSLGHTLASLNVQVELAQRSYERGAEQTQQALHLSKILANQAVQEVRRAVATMRQDTFSLNQALYQLLDNFHQTSGLIVQANLKLPILPIAVSHQLYCILKEGLENIRRHSQATEVTLSSQHTDHHLILHLFDNGIGFEVPQVKIGFGLRGMQERAHIIGATMNLSTAPGQGTTIHIIIPYSFSHDSDTSS